ncbi:SRPBCC domain-containing protein [Erythrobacter sp. YT30]|uniref:SRPBCC domain-containing protein n=1 Tax=Erythrobacter sp. YT30 TaxID=1735012 RepID=UPI00076DDDCB|nr:SRPBCC domain-containing protein [Erythrobacter sp. YT30]KWV90551.1 ATPase [Erythrobacter sp. YT30]
MNELSVTRFIAAPPDKVWEVMADRQDEWWCPSPWRSETKVMERKSGGRWFGVMHGPEGEEIPNDGLMLHWDEGRRFVGTDAVQIVDGEYVPAQAFMIGTWEIEPAQENGVSGTRYTATARHWTAEACEQHKDMGFIEGWKICAEQLASLCEN